MVKYLSLLYHQYTIITNLHLKLRQSLSFLIQILQDSARPLSIIAIFPILTSIEFFWTTNSINNFNKWDPNKAHRRDKVSIYILKLCGNPINKPLVTILKKCFNPNKAGLFEGSFSWGEEWGSMWSPPSYFKKNLSNINTTLYNC